MPIEFLCVGCGRTLRVKETAAGKKARCPECGNIQDVPLLSLVVPQHIPKFFADSGRSQYFCRPCHDQSLRKCIVCGAEVQRRDCHRNRHGEYICRRCQRSKTYRRWLKIRSSQASRAAVYLIASAVTLAVFWTILGWVAQP